MPTSEMVALLIVLLGASAVAGVQVLLVMDFIMEKLRARKPAAWSRRLRIPWAIVSVIGLGCIAWAHWVEPFRYETTYHKIKTASLPEGSRLRILQLTDVHLEGEGPAAEFILRAVQQEKPDVIALTGDYINEPHGRVALEKLLPQLQASREICSVTGNYDGYDPSSACPSVVGLHGFARSISVGGKHVNIFGTDMTDSIEFASRLRSAPKADYTVVLYHTPEMIDTAAANGADLYLCGHTHGGQVRVPFYGAVVTLSDTGKKYEMGLYHAGAMNAYVSRGIGWEGNRVPRLRFLCPPEIAVFDLIGTGR